MSDTDLVYDSVRRFAESVIAPALADLNHYPDRALPSEILQGLSELGLFDLDAESGPTLGVALQALSEIAAAPAAIVLANAFARSIVSNTRPELLAENGASPNLFAAQLYAEPGLVDGVPLIGRLDHALVIEGTARLCVNAPIAKRLVLTVRDALTAEPALVVVDATTPGLEIGPPLLTLGMRGAPSAHVRLSGVRVAEDRVVARGSHAAEFIRMVAFQLSGPATAIIAGIVKSSLMAAAHYARERYQGGSAIIEHEEVRALLSGLIETHALCQQAARELESEHFTEHRALALFVNAKERAAHATTDGVQLLGGYGYMEDFGQERSMRDAKQAQCLFGRTPYQRQETSRAFIHEVSP